MYFYKKISKKNTISVKIIAFFFILYDKTNYNEKNFSKNLGTQNQSQAHQI